jgi:hypothetical protein
MRRELFIVAKERADLYRYLSQTFSDADNVEVIFDRRAGERRGVVIPVRPERRRAERRNRLAVDADLRSVGYAFLVLD